MLNDSKKIIKHKVGLLNLAEELGNVSQALVSRDSREILFTGTNQPWMKGVLIPAGYAEAGH